MSFVLSKILWIFASPAGLLIISLGIGLAMETSSRPAFRKAGRILCLCVFFCLAAISILPVGTWALTPLENRFAFRPPDRIDGIVMLGGDEQPAISEARGEPVALDSMRRYVRFSELARHYPNAKLVFSGGSGRRFELTRHARGLHPDHREVAMAEGEEVAGGGSGANFVVRFDRGMLG